MARTLLDPLTELAVSIPRFMQATGIKSQTTVYKKIRSGEIEAFKVGTHWRIPRRVLLAFCHATAKPTPIVDGKARAANDDSAA